MAAAPSAVLPRADAFEQTTPGVWESFFIWFENSTLRSVRTGVTVSTSPAETKPVNRVPVYSDSSKVTRLAHSSSLCKAYETNNPFVPKMRAGVFPSFLVCCFDVNIIGNMAVTVWPRPGGLCFFCSSITLNVPLSSRENGGFRISSSSREYWSAASIYCHGDNQASFVCYLCLRYPRLTCLPTLHLHTIHPSESQPALQRPLEPPSTAANTVLHLFPQNAYPPRPQLTSPLVSHGAPGCVAAVKTKSQFSDLFLIESCFLMKLLKLKVISN